MNFRLAYRYLLRTPGFAAFAILELALGIGLTTVAFFMVNAVLLRPLDLPEPGRLVQIQPLDKKSGRTNNTAPGLDFRDLRERTRVFTGMAAYQAGKATVLVGKHAEQVRVATVSRGWDQTIGISPAMGTGLFANGANDDSGAVISYSFWHSRMGGDRGVLSRTVQLNGKVYPIRGVLPEGGVFPQETDIWIPVIPENDGSTRTAFNYWIVGRMKPDVTQAQAKANLATVAAALEKQHPKDNVNRSYTLVGLRERLVAGYRTTLLTLSCAVLVVLIIACANVTNLLLARALNRRQELAIRAALGARARHLLEVVLSESLLVAVAGGVLGLLLAMWLRDVLVSWNPFPIPRLAQAGLDRTVILFSALASVACGTVIGLLPAWRVWRGDPHEALAHASSRTATGGGDRLRSGLLVAEVAFSVVLLVGAALLLRSFSRLMEVNPGFRVDHLTVMDCDLSALGQESEVRVAAFYQQMRERALGLPGVVSAGWNRDLPTRESVQAGSVMIGGRAVPAPADMGRLYAQWHLAGPGFFRTLGVPMIAGREFTDRDTRHAPDVAVVNSAFVRRFFPDGENPIGHTFQIGLDRVAPITIVGVTGDVRELAESAGPQLFLPYLQHLNSAGRLYLTVRTSGAEAAPAGVLRASVMQAMPEAVLHFTNMRDVVDDSAAPARFRTAVLGLFSAIALALAMTGLYAVCSYAVQARTREIGLRMALGAQTGNVVRQFVGQAFRLTAAGVAAGVVLAFALRQALAGFLFDTPPTDGWSYAGTVLLVGMGALLASLIPACRASRTDPAVVLREE